MKTKPTRSLVFGRVANFMLKFQEKLVAIICSAFYRNVNTKGGGNREKKTDPEDPMRT